MSDSSATPSRMNTTPRPAAIAATPNATTEVNSDARRNDPVIAVWRAGSSRPSSAYVLPPVAARVCFSMVLASVYAVKGPLTCFPAKRSASSETVIFSSLSWLWTVNHVTAPAMIMMAPATITMIDSTRAAAVEADVAIGQPS